MQRRRAIEDRERERVVEQKKFEMGLRERQMRVSDVIILLSVSVNVV